MAMFQSQVEQVRLPDVTGLVSQIANTNRINPFNSFGKTLDNYLQGQHNIGVAEIENESLNADTTEAVDSVLNWARSKGFTESQIKEAKLLEKRDKLGEIAYRKAQEDNLRRQIDLAYKEDKRKQYTFDRQVAEDWVKDNILNQVDTELKLRGKYASNDIFKAALARTPEQYRKIAEGMLLPKFDAAYLKEITAPTQDQISIYFDPYLDSTIRAEENRRIGLEQQAANMGFGIDKDGNLIDTYADKEIEDRISKNKLADGSLDPYAIAYRQAWAKVKEAFGSKYSPKRLLEAFDKNVSLNRWHDSGFQNIDLDAVGNSLLTHVNEIHHINNLRNYFKDTKDLVNGTQALRDIRKYYTTEYSNIINNIPSKEGKERAIKYLQEETILKIAPIYNAWLRANPRGSRSSGVASQLAKELEKITPYIPPSLPKPMYLGPGAYSVDPVLHEIISKAVKHGKLTD